jgi:hypothetical protein
MTEHYAPLPKLPSSLDNDTKPANRRAAAIDLHAAVS